MSVDNKKVERADPQEGLGDLLFRAGDGRQQLDCCHC